MVECTPIKILQLFCWPMTLLSSLAYSMITHTPPVAGNLPTKLWLLGNSQQIILYLITTEGSILSRSELGPSRWAVGEPSLESVLLSDEFMLVSLTLEFTTLAVNTCNNVMTVYICPTKRQRVD